MDNHHRSFLVILGSSGVLVVISACSDGADVHPMDSGTNGGTVAVDTEPGFTENGDAKAIHYSGDVHDPSQIGPYEFETAEEGGEGGGYLDGQIYYPVTDTPPLPAVSLSGG